MTEPGPFAQLAASIRADWRMQARPEQLAPPGIWSVWLICAGRGFGKTRAGSEWILQKVREGKRHIALLGATAADARDTMVEGPSGILACATPNERPIYEPSKRRLTWPNGAVALCFSADEPERLRGFNGDCAWADELGAYNYPEAWDQLMMTTRLKDRKGKDPQVVVTTTPRPTKIMRELLAREGKGVVVTRGKTLDNSANLAPSFLETIVAKYQGTRLGRQELDAELLFDTPGALWQREWLDRDRVKNIPEMKRIVVAIDPAISTGENADETGIIVAGRDARGHGYILDDLSGKFGPYDWAEKAIKAYRNWKADRIVAEVNQGGLMVENTLRMIDPKVPYSPVHASRGKVTRAEPVSALFEQGKVHMVDSYSKLEDQLCEFTPDFNKSKAGYSPDRVDALVWAITELCVDKQPMRTNITRINLMGR